MVFVIGRSVGVVVLAALAGACPAGAADFASYVNPFNGTQAGAPDFGTGGGAGNTNPGPTGYQSRRDYLPGDSIPIRIGTSQLPPLVVDEILP